MDNSTLGRKAGNDMKKGAGLPKMGNNPASWQTADKGLGFNGQEVTEQRASSSKWNVNQHTGHLNDGRDVQFRQMPNTKGNIGEMGSKRVPPTSANNGKTNFSDPDKINMGAGPRSYGGPARSWDPKRGQNFVGNPDKIQDRQLFNNRGNKDQ